MTGTAHQKVNAEGEIAGGDPHLQRAAAGGGITTGIELRLLPGDASLVTLGLAYETKRGFAGGAYHPVLRRVEEFSDQPISKAIKSHEHRAELLLELEDKVAEAIAKLKERGLQSPYLRSFVAARVNPLRWIKGEELPEPDKVLQTMRDRAARFNTEKVKQQDLYGAFGSAAEEE